MKRGIFFAFLSAVIVGTTALVLVVLAFARPESFRQALFSSRLPGLPFFGRDNGRTNAEIVAQANHGVVTVIASRALRPNNLAPASDPTPPADNNIQRGTGTGFIIDASGIVVTNEHVIKDADRIRVKLADGRERRAIVQGTDSATDLAILKIEADGLTVLPLGDSDSVRVGDPVIAIGNPLEYEHSVTAGIVSAKGRKVYGDQPFEDFIQTDAAINRGNSGGPLLNKGGEVIGVNTVIRVDSRGISFAVPSNVVKRVVEQLQSVGVVERGYLGLMPENLTQEFREGLGIGNLQGVLVGFVSADRPAARAGRTRRAGRPSTRTHPPKSKTWMGGTGPPMTRSGVTTPRAGQRRHAPCGRGGVRFEARSFAPLIDLALHPRQRSFHKRGIS